MRSPWNHLDQFRLRVGPITSPNGATYGAFQIPLAGPSGIVVLNCIASDGFDGTKDWRWEHVSCHAVDFAGTKAMAQRIPSWTEMDYLKDLFWNQEETVVQYHVPKSKHINHNEHVLHLWRPKGFEFQLPPKELV
jgi:hypothetical protein